MTRSVSVSADEKNTFQSHKIRMQIPRTGIVKHGWPVLPKQRGQILHV